MAFPPVEFTIKRDEMGIMSITGMMPDDRVTAVGILEVAIDQVKAYFDKRDKAMAEGIPSHADIERSRFGRGQ